MTDTEKRIAEIREGYKSEPDDNFTYKKEIVEQDIRFLLSELDRRDEENRKLRKERDDAREQAQKYYRKFDDEVVEILRLQDELQSAQQEIERLRQLYEREREIADQALEQVKNLREERNQDRQWIEKASENVTQLQQERDKLIEGLRSIRNELDRLSRESRQKWKREGDMYEQGRADAYDEADVLIRDILKECGVAVD